MEHVYFVMEYINYGDLGSLLEKWGRFLPEDVAFYVAEAILCL